MSVSYFSRQKTQDFTQINFLKSSSATVFRIIGNEFLALSLKISYKEVSAAVYSKLKLYTRTTSKCCFVFILLLVFRKIRPTKNRNFLHALKIIRISFICFLPFRNINTFCF